MQKISNPLTEHQSDLVFLLKHSESSSQECSKGYHGPAMSIKGEILWYSTKYCYYGNRFRVFFSSKSENNLYIGFCMWCYLCQSHFKPL